MKIKISKDFTDTPGARYKTDGPYSAEDFREKILDEKFKIAKEKKETLFIDLDGGMGYGTSFLEEVFGGLQRDNNNIYILDIIKIISNEEPYLKDDIYEYVNKEFKR